MYNAIDIKRNDIIKYMKCIYLVKDFQKLDNGKYLLNYYFRSIRKDNAKLNINDSYEISGYLVETIKKASPEESNFIITRINSVYPNYDTSFYRNQKDKNEQKTLNENDCIDFLKKKGYIVYKQV